MFAKVRTSDCAGIQGGLLQGRRHRFISRVAECSAAQGAGEVPCARSAIEGPGHELRRPIADFLRDGIYELRPTYQGVHYRILYFFNGKEIIVISHGITKRAAVPSIEIDRARERKKKYEADPKAHGWEG